MKSKNSEQHEELLRLVKRTRLDVYDFKNVWGIGVRRRCFSSVFYYTSLNGLGGEPIPLDQVSDEVICKAFAGHYKRAQEAHNPNQGLLFKIYEYE